MEQKAKVAVIGAGSFGIALARLLANKGCDVSVYTRSKENAKEISASRQNVDKLPGVMLPDSVLVTSDMEEACREKEAFVVVVPSVGFRKTLERMKPYVKKHEEGFPPVISCTKGIEQDTLFLMTDVIKQVLPDAAAVVLSGPTHAEEVGRDLPTAIVAGAENEEIAKAVQDLFMTPTFRVYTSTDVTGIETGGALKNVIALAAGIADGMGYGDNAKAAMITRGVYEMTRLGTEMGGYESTFSGLSGIGDLIVTCASMHSRNRRAGILIGKGMSCEEACKEVKMVVEGVNSARAAHALSVKYGVEMPIVSAVNRVLFEGLDPRVAVEALMLRDRKSESGGRVH
ncbi:MAG: NAD(P)-dependent glycerol-3-phosphate dehydrogenase [Lachnospiraceae bacterium]|nr:NAD(P)-dependent glycerol-3-phosphate dehydrogenase [Lachnospiraceae bacterium]